MSSYSDKPIKEVTGMITFLAVLLVTLLGVALAIFGVVAAIAGTVWLLWPLIVAVCILLWIGYRMGKSKKGGTEKEKPENESE